MEVAVKLVSGENRSTEWNTREVSLREESRSSRLDGWMNRGAAKASLLEGSIFVVFMISSIACATLHQRAIRLAIFPS